MAKPASGTPLNTGGPLYTDLNNWYGFLEGSGGTVADGTPNHNTGTLDASVTWTTDADGPLLNFSDNTVNFPIILGSQVVPSLNATNDWTIAFRGKLAAANNFGMVCGDPANTGGHLNYVWMRQGVEFRWQGFAGSTQNLTEFTDITDFTSVHDYVLTGDFVLSVHNLVHLYVDGVESAVSPISVQVGFESLTTIGNGFDTGSSALALVGLMSYFGIWINRALTQSEALALHNDPYGTMYGGVSATRISSLPMLGVG